MATVAFNFDKYTQVHQINGTLLHQWLSRHSSLPRISLTKTVLLERLAYDELIKHIKAGVECQFGTFESDNVNVLKQKLLVITQETSQFVEEIKKQTDNIARYKADMEQAQELLSRIRILDKKTSAIRNSYPVRYPYAVRETLPSIIHDVDYGNCLKEKAEAKATLKLYDPDVIKAQRLAAETKLKEYQVKRNDHESTAAALRKSIAVHSMVIPKPAPAQNQPERSINFPTPEPAPAYPAPSPEPLPVLQPPIPTTPNRTISVDWKDVVFADGGILVRYPVLFLNWYPLPDSRKYLNKIKARYRFRNAPSLQLVINQRTILEVINSEVILYYVSFLTNTCSLLDFEHDDKPVTIGRFQQYTKSFYRHNLPNLFTSRALDHLCQIADEKSSIIPTPELVINSSGSTSIDDSFLFTLKRQNTYYIAWESTEESKATYVFQADQSRIDQTLQTIYDYLVDDIVNKRQTLLCSSSLQRQLGMVTRILHTNFTDWKLQLKSYSS